MRREGPGIVRHRSALGEWETASRPPAPALRGLVRGYDGYTERTPVPLRRRELPSGDVVLIVSLGPRLHLLDPADPGQAGRQRTSFVAGLHQRPVLTQHDGVQHGVEVRLSPPAARMLLGVPMGELADAVVELEDLLGPAAGELAERLHDAPGWEGRFDLLDAALGERLAVARRPPPEVALALARLEATHGGAAIRALAAETGWSRRHLAARFREHVGLNPKVVARILRFRRAVALLEREDGERLAEIAHRCGYADQAHLNRDFRAFAGGSPRDFLALRRPDGGGLSGA